MQETIVTEISVMKYAFLHASIDHQVKIMTSLIISGQN